MDMNYTEKEFLHSYYQIFNDAIKNIKPVNCPTAYILGGQPGAGKTSIQFNIKNNDKNVYVINADAYRKYHPLFSEIQCKYGDDSPKYTQPFVNAVTEKLIQELSNEKYNLIVEGTLRTAAVPMKTAKELKEKGYSVELCVMAVKPEISFESTVLRYENALSMGEIPRATSKEHHDLVVGNITDNLDVIYDSNIFDCIKIFTRDKGCIYSSDMSDKKPSEIEKNILFGKWSDYEKENLLEIIQSIRALKQKRNAEDLSGYMQHSDKLLRATGNNIISDVVKKSNLSLKQVAALVESGIPFKCKKTGENSFIIVFERANIEKINKTLSAVSEQEQPPHQPKIKR
ncbi:MAG: zeta toxin family protein [Clostridia bacterium]|nr:zeta toxin family protein [Clostridia bacterium]